MLKSNLAREQIRKNLTVVLVSPEIPENIGLTARVIKNTRVARLALVKPNLAKKSFDTAKRARDVLQGVPVYETLTEAVSGAHFVFGTTRRPRQYRRLHDFNDILPEIVQTARYKKVHILFGKENFGLSNEEIKKCDSLFFLDSDAGFGSYNLAMAVGIVCYEIFRYSGHGMTSGHIDLAKHRDRRALSEFIDSVLESSKMSPRQRVSVITTLERLFLRTHVTRKEIEVLKNLFLNIR